MEEPRQKTYLFLWNGQGLYLGPGRDSSIHQHYAIQIGISFEQPFLLRYHTHDPFTAIPCFFIAPNRPHQILTPSQHTLFLWLEAESELARTLLVPYASTRFLSTEQVASIQQDISGLKERVFKTVTCFEAKHLVTHVLSAFLPAPFSSSLVDARLALTLQTLKQQVHELTGFSPQQIAMLLHLSESRLRHLFGQQFGLSMQRYLLWQRLLTAMKGTTDGISLTQAAHDAGFADAAHLTRTFRATFGITPSSILKNSHDVQVINCQS